MWRWARGVGDWTSRWKVRRERERERYCIKEEEKYFLKIERERDKRIFLWIVSLDVYNRWREVLNVLCERGL